MTEMKKLIIGELRFIVRKIEKQWRVYDKARGSYPWQSPEFGTVQQDVDQETAEAEATRLNERVKPAVEPVKAGKKPVKPGKRETVQAEQTPLEITSNEDPEDPPELPDYGIMSEEDRKKYEDGLL